MKPRLDPKVIRAGDRVRIVTARALERVGYPKSVKDYAKEIEERLGAQIDELVAAAVPAPRVQTGIISKLQTGWQAQAKEKILAEMGYCAARADGFGGNYRGLFLKDLDTINVGYETFVQEVKTVLTGHYEKGYSSGGGWDGDYEEYTPPCLAIEKAHRLAKVCLNTGFNFSRISRSGDDTVWIPVIYLEKVTT